MEKIAFLYYDMVKYYANDAKRIAHLVKVHSYARAIAVKEEIDKDTKLIIETAALVHNIGIKPALAKYNDVSPVYQEMEAPLEARNMLEKLDFDPNVIDRVCYLVQHIHQTENIHEIDYQILVEADYLAKFLDSDMTMEEIMAAYDNIFKTDSGRELCELMYNLE